MEDGFSLAEEVRQAAGLVEVPGYEIVGELGRGGMGVVYKARQLGLNRWVALKMVLAGAHADQKHLARFQTEAQAVAGLQHPNIVQIYDVGQHKGLPYFSLEFVPGGSLADKVHRQPQPPREAAHLVETLARAVAYAHERGIIHRDLKPANILLTANGIPKITDFGLAKRLEDDSGQTQSGMLLGTPSYMSPEQARGDVREVGKAADIHALGVILYELLTGRPAFQAASRMDTLMRVSTEEAMAPSRLEPDIPHDLETICLKCLQKDPNKRYGTAGLLAEDLRRFLSGDPILARPISGPERLWRWCKRNPKLALSAATIALLLLAVTGISTGAYFRISAEKAATEEQRRFAENQRALAQQAEKKATEQAKIAGEQRALALNTLYNVITRFEETLRDKQEMSGLRKELIELAMNGLNEVSKNVENAALVDRTMGVALQRMGEHYYQMGRTEEALKQFNLSLTLFKKLEEDEPQNDWLPFNEAISYDSLAAMTRELKGDAAIARDYLEKSLRLRQHVLTNPGSGGPPQPRRRMALLVSYDKLASLSDQTGDLKAANDFAVALLKQSQAILAANSDHLQAKQTLTNACAFLGKMSAYRGDVDTSAKYSQQCLDIWQATCQKEPTNATAKTKLAFVFEANGDREAERGRGKEALEWYQKAREIYQPLHQKELQNAELQWRLAFSFFRMATARRLSGDLAGADKDDRESLRLREVLAKTDPNNFQRIEELMLSRARCGNYQQAAKDANDLHRRGARDASLLISIARCYGACIHAVRQGLQAERIKPSEATSLCRMYADSALQSIEQAIALGYRDSFTLEHDLDLQPVQTEAGFKALVSRLKQIP
jgi:serine/threonine-protein kinase